MAQYKKSGLRVPYGLAVHGTAETKRVHAVLNDCRTIMGRETQEFEECIAGIFGKRYGVAVNSGSSANLLAIELLRLPRGSEIITPLLTFSTTVAPMVQKGLIPVFADVEEGAYTVNVGQVEQLITKKTKALMIPLLLGNVPDMARLRAIARKRKLFFIEDSCDTLGASFNGRPTGTYSDISTTSFYGSHIITAGGQGGMILMNRSDMRDRARVLRGWGRSSSIFSESESIAKRFGTKIAGITYDAKFLFDEIGYNFMPPEIGSAFGNAQLERLSEFRKIRERNFSALLRFFRNYEHVFILPKQDPRAQTQWLAFPLTIRTGAPFSRLAIVTFLERHNVQTRPIFTGNILAQPGFKAIAHRKIRGGYSVTNEIMERGFVVGCHQGLGVTHIRRLEELFIEFLSAYTNKT